jgi:aspartyl-tRNA(Asn)/glutamyl-tRNA(Gln) amidotransferase subunit C
MTIEDLKETAALAHLNLDEGELADAFSSRMFAAFEQMVGYFAAMQAADEDRIAFPEEAALSGSVISQTVSAGSFRPDCTGSFANNAGEPASGPVQDGRFLVIPRVL